MLQSNTGWTALHEAACNGRTEAARTLLHLGADVDRRTKEGDTALHKAARWGRVDIVQLLLLVGADARARDKVRCLALSRATSVHPSEGRIMQYRDVGKD